MNAELDNDEQIRRYLLGELADEEQDQLEDRAFADKDYMENVLAVERDLIDEYVHGELTTSELKNFNERFLISAQRRGKVEFARALHQAANEDRVPEPDANKSGWKSVFLWTGPRLAYGLSLAALVLIALLVGFWYLRHPRTPEPAQANLQKPTPQPPSPTTNAQTNASSIPTPSPTTESHQPVVASLLLLPGTSRGDQTAQRLVLTPYITTVELRAVVAKGDEYPSYQLELRTAKGTSVRSQSGLSAHNSRAGRIVVLNVPAHQLASGDYELTLNGINDQKRAEPLSYYYFHVQKEQ